MLLLALVACGEEDQAPGETCSKASGTACLYAGIGIDGIDSAPNTTPIREARLYFPIDMEFAPDGTPYVLDWNNHLVRRVTDDGYFETVIGSDLPGDGPPDMSDNTPPGAPGTTVALNHPTDIQFDDDGNLLLDAWHNHKLRVWDPKTGLVTVLCGAGPGYAGDGGTLAQTRLNQPKALVRDTDGTLYILDQRNQRIRRISPDGDIATIAGTGMPGFAGDGGPAVDAQLSFATGGNPEPSGGLALDGTNLYVADGLNYRIRRIDLDKGTIETIAGTGEEGFSGDGGKAKKAKLSHVRDIEIGPDGRLYLADTDNHRIRAIDLEKGTIDTVVGDGDKDLTDGEGKLATEHHLARPMGIAFDADDMMYIADTEHSRILKVIP